MRKIKKDGKMENQTEENDAVGNNTGREGVG